MVAFTALVLLVVCIAIEVDKVEGWHEQNAVRIGSAHLVITKDRYDVKVDIVGEEFPYLDKNGMLQWMTVQNNCYETNRNYAMQGCNKVCQGCIDYMPKVAIQRIKEKGGTPGGWAKKYL